MLQENGTLKVFDTPEQLSTLTAEWLCVTLASSTADRVSVCLSGGSTPKRLYQDLTGDIFHNRFPWPRVHWFWGDERFVPPDHPDSNYRMTREAMLSAAPIPPENIHPIPTVGVTPEESATEYERTLRAWHDSNGGDGTGKLFDVTLLGLGTDGHTASLMPNSQALFERTKWAAVVPHDPPGYRITLTYPALDNSEHVVFLVTGADKREMLKRARQGDASLPSAHIHPRGLLHWFVDKAAIG